MNKRRVIAEDWLLVNMGFKLQQQRHFLGMECRNLSGES